MYGIFTYIWVIFRVNVGKYSIHGAYGIDGKIQAFCLQTFLLILSFLLSLKINFATAFLQPKCLNNKILCFFSNSALSLKLMVVKSTCLAGLGPEVLESRGYLWSN